MHHSIITHIGSIVDMKFVINYDKVNSYILPVDTVVRLGGCVYAMQFNTRSDAKQMKPQHTQKKSISAPTVHIVDVDRLCIAIIHLCTHHG